MLINTLLFYLALFRSRQHEFVFNVNKNHKKCPSLVLILVLVAPSAAVSLRDRRYWSFVSQHWRPGQCWLSVRLVCVPPSLPEPPPENSAPGFLSLSDELIQGLRAGSAGAQRLSPPSHDSVAVNMRQGWDQFYFCAVRKQIMSVCFVVFSLTSKTDEQKTARYFTL